MTTHSTEGSIENDELEAKCRWLAGKLEMFPCPYQPGEEQSAVARQDARIAFLVIFLAFIH